MNRKQYLAEVQGHFTDLPWRVRQNLVDDLRAHLNELPAEEDLAAHLGHPGTYAAELRAAAGLARRKGPIAFLRARRPRNLVIAIVVLALAAAIAAAAAWARSYQPIVSGSTGMHPLVSGPGALGEIVAPFRNGKPFQVGFSVRNNGRFAVRILGIASEGFNYPFTARTFVARSGPRGTTPPVPFHAFTLEPGQERLLVLRGSYANCEKWAAGTSLVIERMPVRARFLVWTQTVRVRLFTPVVIRMPAHRNPCSTG